MVRDGGYRARHADKNRQNVTSSDKRLLKFIHRIFPSYFYKES